MWLRSVFLKTLCDYRAAILSWGLGMGTLVVLTYFVFKTQDQRNAALPALARQFTFYAEPVDILRAGGYVTWRLSPLLATLAIWALLAGSHALRGEEERGALDALLALPLARGRMAIEKLAALGAALLLIGVIVALAALVGGASASDAPTVGAASLFGLNAALLAGVFGALAFFLSQFTRERRPAAGLAGGLLGLAYLLDSAGRVAPGAGWAARLSPLFYYNLSKPLAPSYGANPGALLTLAALLLAFGGAGVWLFLRRDVGAPAALAVWLRLKAPGRLLDRGRAALEGWGGRWSLRSVYARGLGATAGATFWWSVAIAASAALFTSLARQLERNLAAYYGSSSFFSKLVASLGGGDIATNSGILSLFLAYFPLLLTIFAVTQVNRWAADEEEGQLDLVLATPRARPRLMLARFAALATAALVIALVLLAAVAAAAAASGLAVNGWRLLEAALGMVPLALLVAAIGYLLAGWLRAAAVTGALSGLVVLSYAVNFLAALVQLPDALLHVSIFQLYGAPLVNGLRLENTLGMLAVTALALALATARFARKDIAS